jgi:Flp pilus assembly protein TadG
MSEARAALVERMATVCGGNYFAANAALDIALEEAARIADKQAASIYDDDLIETGRLQSAKEIATAIRSLKSPDTSPSPTG